MPYSTMSKKMRNSISLNKDNILDYGLSLNFDEKINIGNNVDVRIYNLREKEKNISFDQLSEA